MGGVRDPYESGQSGTDNPASLPVTRAPAMRSRNVQNAVRQTNLCSERFIQDSYRKTSARVAHSSSFCRKRDELEWDYLNSKFILQETVFIESVKSAVFDSCAPTVTFWIAVPSFSCQASMVYSPGGKPLIAKEPSFPVTAKNGCFTTPM